MVAVTTDGAGDARAPMVFRIPPEPDAAVRSEVERSTLSPSPNCCCQIEVHLFADSESVLYSLDSDGNRKTAGGDEFYIRYEEERERGTRVGDEKDGADGESNSDSDSRREILTRAVALIADRCDGSYELDFCATPMNPLTNNDGGESGSAFAARIIKRTLTVCFEYTDRIGSLAPPSKRDWSSGGYSHKRYEFALPDALHSHSHSHSQTDRPLLVREFVPPRPCVDLGGFDQVFAFGDSTFCQLVRQRPNKKGKYYFQPNLRVLGEKVRMGLNSETVGKLVEQMRDDEVEKELARNSDSDSDSDSTTKTPTNNNKKKKALIVGSCLWDILSADDELQGPGFEDHARACQDYVRLLRERYPGVTIVWKSPMAVHIHWVDLQRVVEHDRSTATLFGRNRIKYMSGSRSRYLYELQKRTMEELGVPVMDLYEATYLSADWLYPSDGRHYKPDLNRTMLGWFYPKDNNNNNNNNNSNSNNNNNNNTADENETTRDGQKRVYYQHVVF